MNDINENASAHDQRMEKVIHNYLTMETSYALLINGPRGIGKTFFIKDRVIQNIKKVKVFHDQRKSYIPVYISLYGIKSIDEVYTLLAIELIPWLKNKDVKVGLSVGKLVVRGLLNFKSGGDVDHYLKDMAATSKNAIDTKNFVMIFDDLDRISGTLEVGEIIGFVNSLVEHENNKILVIADEEHLKENKNYIAVKEKTIGTIIEYSATTSHNYDAIISSKYKAANRPYYDYLVILKEEILHWFEVTDTKNLRTLIYFLQHFQEIFSRVHFQLNLKDYDPGSMGFKKLKTILLFVLAVSIEFKKGSISYQQQRGLNDMKAINELLHLAWLKDMFTDHLRSQQPQGPRSAEKSYKENFLDAFYSGKDYDYYPSIFNFITGGDAFDTEGLLAQLKRNFDDKIYRPSPQDMVYQQLAEPGVLNLSNEEYIKLTGELLTYAVKGSYPLDRYLSVLYYLERYPEIKQYDISKEAAKLMKGVKGNQQKFQYDDNLTSKFGIEKDRPNYQHFLALFRALNEVNNSIKTAQIASFRADLFQEFKYDKDLFYQKCEELNWDTPIFAHWDFTAFQEHFQVMPSAEIPRFSRFLKNRFETALIKERLEYFFIENLYNKVQKIDTTREVTMRDIVIKKLGMVLNDIIEKNYTFKKV